MFAKLKKKIQEETRNVVIGNEEKKHPRPSMSGTSSAVSSPGTAASSPSAAVSSSGTAMSSPRSSTSSRGTPSPQPAASSPGPGLASPVNKDFQGVVPVHSLSDTSSRSYHRADSESSALDTDSKDKEEILAMLIKRTDQVKRLESKISDLAAMVKEKNRQVEKLELSLEGLHNASQQPLNGSERNKLTKTPSADVNTDYDVSKITDQMRASNNHADRRESELMSLQKQIDVLTDRCRDLEERNQFLEKNIENERSAKEEALSKCAKLEKELEELQEFRQVYETLKMQLESLRADSELEKKKLQTEIEAKNQQCSNLQDKIIMLEKRLKDSNLTEDDQIQAIEKQRETLELQLSEVQEQLAQLKLVSGHKVAALEQKVQHLNSKVAEQVRELSKSQRNLQDARNASEREVESWKNKLQMALLEVMEKSKQLETQKQNHESEIARRQKNASLLEDELREQINQLQSQLETVDKSRQREKQAFQDKIAKLENKQEEWLEQEIDRERQVTQLEDELRKLKGEVLEKDNEIMSLRHQMEQKREELALAEKKRVEDQESTKEHLKNADKYQSSVITLENELHTCTQEKDSLLLRNAQLSQEFESYKRRMMSELKDLQQDVGEKDEVIKQLEQCSTDLHQQINMLQEKITELEQRQEEVVGVAQCEEVNELKRQLLESENQLADKNKTIKMLQQRLNELKKTLQRELKVQSLPNDETSGRLTPSSSTKDLNQSASAMTNNVTNNHKHEDSVPASIPVTAQRRLDCPPSHQSKRSNLSHRHHCLPAYSSVPQDVLASQHTQNSSLRGHYCDPKDFSYDINFEYLKHVVLKFLLSREHEAVHLIKALSMLLHFTPDEQRLIKDTLDWKMSWFGTRPQLGRGQLAKVIPSSY